MHAVLPPGCDGGVLGRNRGAAVPSTTCDDGQRIQGDAKKKPPRHLIRGGTTSVGLAAAAIAKNHKAIVAATTRNPGRDQLLRASGVDQVFIDAGSIAQQVKEVCPGGVDKVLELVHIIVAHHGQSFKTSPAYQTSTRGSVRRASGLVQTPFSTPTR